jgi:hypothetical protein
MERYVRYVKRKSKIKDYGYVVVVIAKTTTNCGTTH